MTEKYALTDQRIMDTDKCVILTRVVALRDIDTPKGIVKKGTLGGYVVSNHNLSQDGECWIGENSRAYGQAKVSENALLTSEAIISDDVNIMGFAIIDDQSIIKENATITGNCHTKNNTRIDGNVYLTGNITC